MLDGHTNASCVYGSVMYAICADADAGADAGAGTITAVGADLGGSARCWFASTWHQSHSTSPSQHRVRVVSLSKYSSNLTLWHPPLSVYALTCLSQGWACLTITARLGSLSQPHCPLSCLYSRMLSGLVMCMINRMSGMSIPVLNTLVAAKTSARLA